MSHTKHFPQVCSKTLTTGTPPELGYIAMLDARMCRLRSQTQILMKFAIRSKNDTFVGVI